MRVDAIRPVPAGRLHEVSCGSKVVSPFSRRRGRPAGRHDSRTMHRVVWSTRAFGAGTRTLSSTGRHGRTRASRAARRRCAPRRARRSDARPHPLVSPSHRRPRSIVHGSIRSHSRTGLHPRRSVSCLCGGHEPVAGRGVAGVIRLASSTPDAYLSRGDPAPRMPTGFWSW